MKILVTGANGFIGKNLIAELKNQNYTDILAFDRDTDQSLLDSYTRDCEFVFHLAGINRPESEGEYMEGNFGFTSHLLDSLKRNHSKAPVMISSSIQASLDNPYGRSKKAGEDLLFNYGMETGTRILVYRFPNVFGKWCKANYNSAIATFCHNIAHDLPIQVNDPSIMMKLVYIDDLVEELMRALAGNETKDRDFCEVPVTYRVSLGEIVALIHSFKESRKTLAVPNISIPFEKNCTALILAIYSKINIATS